MPDRAKLMAKLVGRRIRQLRQNRGWGQVDLASQMDDAVGQTAISQYETGQKLPSMSVLLRLADAFEVPVQVLLLEPGDDPRHEVAVAALTGSSALLARMKDLLLG